MGTFYKLTFFLYYTVFAHFFHKPICGFIAVNSVAINCHFVNMKFYLYINYMKPRIFSQKHFNKMVIINGQVVKNDEIDSVIKRGRNNKYKQFITGHEGTRRIDIVKPVNPNTLFSPMLVLGMPFNRTVQKRVRRKKRGTRRK